MWKRRLHCEASPGGEVWRVITSAFITSCMVDCILYCSGTGRAIHLHWLSYSRRLYGSGKEYQHEMSGWFGWPFTFLRIAAVIVLSLLPCPLLSSGILKIPQVKFFPTERKIVVLRKKLGNKELCWKDNSHKFLFGIVPSLAVLLCDTVVIAKSFVKCFLESALPRTLEQSDDVFCISISCWVWVFAVGTVMFVQ